VKTRVEAHIQKALLQGRRYDAIAKELRVSTKTIAKVAKEIREISPTRVFEMFDNGITPWDVVKKTNADPTKINEWFKAWVEMHGLWDLWERSKGGQTAMLLEESIGEDEKSGGIRDLDYYRKLFNAKG